MKSEGSVKGDEITWTTKRQGPNGEMVIVYKGKIEAQGDERQRRVRPDGQRGVEGREDRAVAASVPRRGARRAAAAARLVLALVVAGALAAWGALALWFDGPASRPAAALLAVAFSRPSHFRRCASRRADGRSPRPLVAFAVVLAWWLRLAPSNDRAWLPDVARTPRPSSRDSVVTLRDVRHFDYRSETDFGERWETRRYDLDAARGLDLFVSFWGPTLYAHTILSFQFEGARRSRSRSRRARSRASPTRPFAASSASTSSSTCMADERDVIGLRARFRGERVRLYRLATPRGAGARAVRAVPGGSQCPRARAGLVQRLHAELHDRDLAQRPRDRAAEPLRLAAARERLPGRAALRARAARHAAAARRAARAQRRHRADEALRRAGRLLELHPRGAAAARVAARGLEAHTARQAEAGRLDLDVGPAPDRLEALLDRRRLGALLLELQRPREAVEPPAVVGQLREVLAEDGLGLGEAARPGAAPRRARGAPAGSSRAARRSGACPRAPRPRAAARCPRRASRRGTGSRRAEASATSSTSRAGVVAEDGLLRHLRARLEERRLLLLGVRGTSSLAAKATPRA